MDNNPENELKDVQEAISRFCAANKNDVIFISDFSAYNPETGKIKDNILGLYGHKDILLSSISHLIEIILDAADENGFVNI